MPILVQCPTCQQEHDAPDTLAGQACACSCGAVVQVPLPLIARCPKCGMEHRPPDELAGQLCRCTCGHILKVPDLEPVVKTSIFQELTNDDLKRRRSAVELNARPATRTTTTSIVPTPAPTTTVATAPADEVAQQQPTRSHEAYEHALDLEARGILNESDGVPGCIKAVCSAMTVTGGIVAMHMAINMFIFPLRQTLIQYTPDAFRWILPVFIVISPLHIVLGCANIIVASMMFNKSRAGIILAIIVCVLDIPSLSWMTIGGILGLCGICNRVAWRYCEH